MDDISNIICRTVSRADLSIVNPIWDTVITVPVMGRGMLVDEFLTLLRGMDGVITAEIMPSDLVQEVAETESSVDTITGGMVLENIGLFQCLHHENVFVLISEGFLQRSEEITMRMIDTEGVVIGHDVPDSMREELSARKDLIWMSDGFVLFPELITNRDAKMVMGCSTLRLDGVPGDVTARMFYPSIASAELINRRYGVEGQYISAAVIGVDGLDPSVDGSVPVSDVVEVPGGGSGHGESSPEDALYRGHLVGEGFHLAEFPLADKDLHAFLVVEVDVNRCLHHVGAGVLYVGELVPDRGHGVVVDHDDGAHHPFIIVLPFVLREGIADKVANGLGSADVSLLRDGFIELLEEFGLEGNTYTCYAIHVSPHPSNT